MSESWTAPVEPIDRNPTADELAGIDWWNSLSERDRAEWLRRASSAKPADAWAEYKRASGIDEVPSRA